MIAERLLTLGAELSARREPFVTATVVRVQHPTSAIVGGAALVRADGTLDGFVGGVCAEHSVRVYALQAIETGEPLLLRIMPDSEQADPDAAPIDAGQELGREEGAVTVRNTCLSGGAIEVFLEPTLPPPRLLAAGETPIVAALAQIGPVAGFEVVTSAGPRNPLKPAPGDLGLIVAAHGRDELSVLRAALAAELPYVGLVASPERGAAVLGELFAKGVTQAAIDRVDTPAGLELGARTPGEIAVAIIARVIELRRSLPAAALGAAAQGSVAHAGAAPGRDAAGAEREAAPGLLTAVDPICGMTVVVDDETPSAERDGETFHFCCDGCRRSFVSQQES